MIQRTVERMYDRDRGEPVPGGHLRQRRQGGPVLQGLQLRRDDPEHRRPRRRRRRSSRCSRPAQPGLRVQHLLDAIVDEFAENEDLPNTTNPDDWARISGKKGERIVYIRTLVTGQERRGRAGDRHGDATPASTCRHPSRTAPRTIGPRRRSSLRAGRSRLRRTAWTTTHRAGNLAAAARVLPGVVRRGRELGSAMTYVAVAGILLIFALAVVVGVVDARTARALAAGRGRTPPRVGGRAPARRLPDGPAAAVREALSGVSDPFTTAARRLRLAFRP